MQPMYHKGINIILDIFCPKNVHNKSLNREMGIELDHKLRKLVIFLVQDGDCYGTKKHGDRGQIIRRSRALRAHD